MIVTIQRYRNRGAFIWACTFSLKTMHWPLKHTFLLSVSGRCWVRFLKLLLVALIVTVLSSAPAILSTSCEALASKSYPRYKICLTRWRKSPRGIQDLVTVKATAHNTIFISHHWMTPRSPWIERHCCFVVPLIHQVFPLLPHLSVLFFLT